MFGLTSLLAALSRLAASLNAMADTVDHCNTHIRTQARLDVAPDVPAIEDHTEASNAGNGRKRKVTA